MTHAANASLLRSRLMPALALARDTRRPGVFKVNVSTVVADDDHILMIREGRGRKRGRWNLPGGKAHSGETLTQTAIRETFEETGYEIQPLGLLALFINARGQSKPSIRLHLSARLMGGDIHIDGEEVLDVRWFTVDQLRSTNPKKLWNPGMIHQTLDELQHGNGHPLTLLKDVDANLATA